MRSDALMRHDLHHVVTEQTIGGEKYKSMLGLGALGKHLWGAAIMLVGSLSAFYWLPSIRSAHFPVADIPQSLHR